MGVPRSTLGWEEVVSDLVLFDKILFIITSGCGNGFVVVLTMKKKKRTLIVKKYILKYLLMK